MGLLEPHGGYGCRVEQADLSNTPRTLLNSKGAFAGAFAIGLAATLPFIRDVSMLAYFGPLALLLLGWELTVGRRLTYLPAQGRKLIWPALCGLALPLLALTLAHSVTSTWRI